MAEGKPIPKGSTVKSKGRLAECYKRGVHLATGEKNYDYAHAMFAECVLNDPGNLQFVEAMVQNLRARTPRVRKWRLPSSGNRTLKKALQHQNWAEVIRKGVELLKTDPWNVATLRAMAQASAARHHNEVELVYLKQALDAEPKNVEVNRHCGHSLGRMGQFDQAIACWHRVEKLKGKDEEAAKMISMLAEEKLKYPGGHPPLIKAKEALVEEAEPKDTPHDVVLSPRQKLEQAITRDPQNIANYLELAELLSGANQFNAAETLLTRAIDACGDQQVLVVQLDRVRYLRAEEQRMLAEERALEQQITDAPLHIPWLPIVLALAIVFLALQLIPSIGNAVWRTLDVAHWSRSGWVLFNIFVLLVLIAVRFSPNLFAYARRRRIRKHRASAGKF